MKTKLKRRITSVLGAILGATVVASLLSGCHSTDPDRGDGAVVPLGASDAPPREFTIVDGRSDAAVTWDTVVAAAAASEVVLIGELHGHPLGLRLAGDLWEDVLRSTSDAALSLEFLYRDQQAAVDDYLTGVIDAEQFFEIADVDRAKFPDEHWRMINAARNDGRPVFASNSPWRYSTYARLHGYGALRDLTPEQRRLFAIPEWIPDGRYWDEFRSLMGDHGSGGGVNGVRDEAGRGAGDYFRAQILWDATMTETIVTAVDRSCSPVVQVAGQMHVGHGGGITGRLERDHPDLRVVTIAMVDSFADELRRADAGLADFVVYIGRGKDD